MTKEQFDARTTEILAEERKQPIHWIWLSFASDKGFEGVVIVPDYGLLHAIRQCHLLGINPGGEVRGFDIDEKLPREIEQEIIDHAYRLLNKEEALALDARFKELRGQPI